MKNYVQPGNAITATAPSGGVSSGAGVLIGALFGVAATTQDEGDDVELATVGCFDLGKDSSVFAFGDRVYWDVSEDKATASPGTGDPAVGVAIGSAATGAATVRTRLDGKAAV
ncbi:MAG: DUF2190 family protein [Pseudomonadota bacterium]|nr:DUF2190 family protein [Pseudomonadota bacterium]